ncbi:hypothetical protein C5E10_04025 [Pseudoclavibacter sp. RFBG4]|nr:hypothetical protein C5E10_04025 [Pseudoclavibacter sp. RFBG4]
MDVVLQWGASLLTLCGFGLAMGLNPALYAATGDLLARNIDVGKRLGWMLLGLALGATVLLLVFRSFDPTTLVTTLRGSLDTALLNRTLDLIVGTIFLVSATAVLIWRARARDFPRKPKTGSKPRASAAGYFLLGLGACVGFTTLPIMYLTGRLLHGLTADDPLRVVAYAVFLLALAAPFLTLAWVWTKIPSLAARVVGFYSRAADWDYRRTLAILLVLAGLLFLWLGIFAPRGL